MNGILRQVSLGTNMVAGVNHHNDAFMTQWNFSKPSHAQANWKHLPGKWKKVSVSADNQLWGVDAGGKAFKFQKSKQEWREIPNPTNINFRSIAVGRRYIYATATDTRIYRCARPCKIGGWQLTANGFLQEVSGEHAADDTVFGINNGNTYRGKVQLIK